MTIFDFSASKPLSIGEKAVRTATFDGCYHYFPVCYQQKVIQTTHDYKPVCEIHTQRDYQYLTYLPLNHFFYATVRGVHTRLFILDCNFNEVDCVIIPSHGLGAVTSLSYDCCLNGVLISFTSGLMRFDITDKIWITLPPVRGILACALALCPCYLVVSRMGEKQILTTLSAEGELLTERELPLSPLVECMIFNPCAHTYKVDKLELYFQRQHCYPHICEIPVTPHDLGFTPCLCHGRVCCQCCQPQSHSVDEVLTSVALVETALAHILNAQGEHLQKAVAICDDVSQLLTVNQEINDTIVKVAQLEQLLVHKLEALCDICPLDLTQEHVDSHPCSDSRIG